MVATPLPRTRRRRAAEVAFRVATYVALVLVLGPAAWILIGVIARAVPHWQWSVLTTTGTGTTGGLRAEFYSSPSKPLRAPPPGSCSDSGGVKFGSSSFMISFLVRSISTSKFFNTRAATPSPSRRSPRRTAWR